jgi:MFS family permease
LKETLTEKHRLHPSLIKVNKTDLFEPRVVTPCLVMVLCAYAYGAVFTVIPDLGQHLGIKNKGLLFTYLTIASLLVRILGGKASDKWGRKTVLKISSLTIACAMTVIAFADSTTQLIVGMVLYGLGQGTTSPTLLAWATDLSDPIHKGRGIASLYIFMELGIGIGAFASGLVYGNSSSHFFSTFIICAVLPTIAFIYLVLHRMRDNALV